MIPDAAAQQIAAAHAALDRLTDKQALALVLDRAAAMTPEARDQLRDRLGRMMDQLRGDTKMKHGNSEVDYVGHATARETGFYPPGYDPSARDEKGLRRLWTIILKALKWA